MAPHRILLATYFDTSAVGGLSTHVTLLKRALEAQGREVMIVDGRHLRSRAITITGVLASLGSRDRYRVLMTRLCQARLARRITRAIREFQPDVVHVHDMYALAALHRHMNNVPPLILTVHGPALNEAVMSGIAPAGSLMHKAIQVWQSQAYRTAKRIIAVDSLQRKMVIDSGADEEKVVVVLNAVDSGPAIVQDGELGDYILVPRRLVPKNGVHVAVRAFGLLATRYSWLRLVVAGGGPLMAELQALASDLGAVHRISFLGDVSREQVTSLLKGARAVIVPSVPVDGVIEASSIAALEAMAAGKAVVASRIGGLAEIINDGVTGFLVPPGDAEIMAQRVAALLDSPSLGHGVGTRAQVEAIERFGLERWVDQIAAVYRMVG